MAASKKALSDRGLNKFISLCKQAFASKTVVDKNDSDMTTYVLDLKEWYDANLYFDPEEPLSPVVEEEEVTDA